MTTEMELKAARTLGRIEWIADSGMPDGAAMEAIRKAIAEYEADWKEYMAKIKAKAKGQGEGEGGAE